MIKYQEFVHQNENHDSQSNTNNLSYNF